MINNILKIPGYTIDPCSLPCRSELSEFGHGRKVFALKFHPFDDNVFITGGWDKCIKVRC